MRHEPYHLHLGWGSRIRCLPIFHFSGNSNPPFHCSWVSDPQGEEMENCRFLEKKKKRKKEKRESVTARHILWREI